MGAVAAFRDFSVVADIGIFKAAIGPVIRLWRRPADIEASSAGTTPEEQGRRLFRDGLIKFRSGDAQGALADLDRCLALSPDLADAVMTRAELLDSLGRVEEAGGDYQRARELWAAVPSGGADRRYLFRRQGQFAFEIVSYDLVRTNVRGKILPQLAHGNALLARGWAAEALHSYELALKIDPKLREALALKGEALSALGRYAEAIEIFDKVLADNPRDVETLNARGIARLASGRLADANEDWQTQLNLTQPANSAARGCLAMRLGNYSVAYAEFELARIKQPNNGYWPLYRLAAGRLAGIVTDMPTVPNDERWPSLLLGFLAGQCSEDGLLERANSPERQAEARFQIGVAAAATNPALARRQWKEVVERGHPALIEVAAATNALARLGS